LPDAVVTPLRVEPVAGAIRLALALAEGHAVVPEYDEGERDA
jgi:hypothetical protein